MARRNKTMKKEMKIDDCCSGNLCRHQSGSACGFYGLGFLGAVIYYIQTATGFWSGALGVLKAIIWPVFVVYKLLGL